MSCQDEVDEIVDYRYNKRTKRDEYLISWVECESETWEPLENFNSKKSKKDALALKARKKQAEEFAAKAKRRAPYSRNGYVALSRHAAAEKKVKPEAKCEEEDDNDDVAFVGEQSRSTRSRASSALDKSSNEQVSVQQEQTTSASTTSNTVYCPKCSQLIELDEGVYFCFKCCFAIAAYVEKNAKREN